ncbi:hypothetical protein LSCM4_07642 [Leishmania orientalis]|uniref:Uncharacterized protein n=1 Tax=Leishmania orientalis TaxID=2249476 RepID=A0A836HXW9_9TRYP|nr:hypothetical protein LSCM4_07642 [Leishmania orientalis]
MTSCESPFSITTPSSPVHPTAHRFDTAGGTVAAIITGAARIMTDTATMSPPRSSAPRTVVKKIESATPTELSQMHPHPHHQQQRQRQQQPCSSGFLDPFFLTEIDQNVQSFNGAAGANGSRTSLSGDAASANAKDATLLSPRVEDVSPARVKAMCRSRSACEVQRDCRPHTLTGNGFRKDEADDGRRKRRQPSSSPPSSRRDTADCFSSGEAVAPIVEVTAADSVVTATATASAAEAELSSPGAKSRSLLPAWATGWSSTTGKASALSTDSGVATGRVSACLASPGSFSFLHSRPGSDNRDTPEGTYTLDCKTTLLPGESVVTAVSADSSAVSVHVCEAQESAAHEVKSSAATGATTVRAAAKLLASLILRCSPSSTASPHPTSHTKDLAADAGRRQPMELHSPVMLPSIIEEVPCGVEHDVLGAHEDEMCDMKVNPVPAMEDADRRRRVVAEGVAVRPSSASRRAQHSRWSVHLLPVTAWLRGSSAVGASMSKALWRAFAWSWPALLTPCPCASARTEQRTVQAPSTVLASEAAGSENCASRWRRSFAFTSPDLYMSPPSSFQTYTPLTLPAKVAAMLCCRERHRASLSFPARCSSSKSGNLCAVPPPLTIGSTTSPMPLMQHPVTPPLVADTSAGPARTGHFTRDPSRPTAAAEEGASRQSCDLRRLTRCYTHFERAVEQHGDGGVWPARGFSSLAACESANLMTAASVAETYTDSRLHDDGDEDVAWPLSALTLDSEHSTLGTHGPTSPRLASTFPFSPVSAVLRCEKEEDIFTSAAMWALEQMSDEN